MAQTARKTPWSARAAELSETEGVYADYAAWQEWAAEQWFTGSDNFETLDSIDMAGWYALCLKSAGK